VTQAMHQILLIEDEPAIRKVLRVLLEAENYRCIEADTALRAEIETRSHKPDLLLLDLILPGHSGFEILKAAREARPTLQDTGSTDRSTVQAGPGDGVTTHAHPRSRRAEGQRSSTPILYTGCSQLSSTALRIKETRGKTYGTCTQPGGIVIREWSDSGKFATGHHGRAPGCTCGYRCEQ